MSTPSGYPGSGNEPYGSAGPNPTGPGGGFTPPNTAGSPLPGQYQQPGQYQPAQNQHPPYQQPSYPPPGQYGQYPTPAPGYPAGYGQPGYGTTTGTVRPGMVTAAAVLAFIWGGLGILFGLLGLVAGSVLTSVGGAVCNSSNLSAVDAANCGTVAGAGTFLIIVTIGLIVVAALMIWGGVVALNGKNGQILVIACGVYAALAILSIIISSFGFTSLLGFVIPVLIVVFMLNAQSKNWFKVKGGKTF
jgi:hypothetical protein